MEKPTFRQRYFLLVLVHAAIAFAATSVPSRAPSSNPLPPTNPRCIDNPAWSSRDFKRKDCYSVLVRFHAQEIEESHGIIVPLEFLAPGTPGRTVFTRVLTPRKYYFGMPCTAVGLLCGSMVRSSSADHTRSLSKRNLHTGNSNAQLLRPERARSGLRGDRLPKRRVFFQRCRVLCTHRCE